MKLGQARQITSERLSFLVQRKRELTGVLKGDPSASAGGANYDRVELTRTLNAVQEEYEQTLEVAHRLSELDANIQNAEASRQQGEAQAEAMEELMKILEVFRRISKGDKVPATDERKLMEYSSEMYMAAKNMALLRQRCDGKEHESLWADEEPEEEPVDPSELAANTEVGDPLAQVASAGSADLPAESTGAE